MDTKMNTYITIGVKEKIPLDIVLNIIESVDNISLDVRDYLQVFIIKSLEEGLIVLDHSQEVPEFHRTYYLTGFNFKIELNEKLYMVIEEDYRTLMLVEEY